MINSLEKELIEQIRKLEPDNYLDLMSHLLNDFSNSLYSSDHNLEKVMKLGKQIRKFMEHAKVKQKRALYNNFEKINNNSLIIQAQQLQKIQKQKLFITQINPIIINFIDTQNNLKTKFSQFEIILNKENSLMTAIKKNEELFLSILEDIVYLEIIIKNINTNFMKIAKEFLTSNNHPNNKTTFSIFKTSIDSYSGFRKNNQFFKGFLRPLLKESILYTKKI